MSHEELEAQKWGWSGSAAPVPPSRRAVAFSEEQEWALKHARLALTYSVLGFFVLGATFGPLAVSHGLRAKEMGRKVGSSILLGVIDTVLGLCWIAGMAYMVYFSR